MQDYSPQIRYLDIGVDFEVVKLHRSLVFGHCDLLMPTHRGKLSYGRCALHKVEHLGIDRIGFGERGERNAGSDRPLHCEGTKGERSVGLMK
jgi:hypothetical protein